MAVDYLRLIQEFAAATGYRQLYSAPAANKKIQSVPLTEANRHAHFVYDLDLTRQVLRTSDIFPQDHFLDKLLEKCDHERVKWVKLFVEKSPEFLDGPYHTIARKSLKTYIDRFVKTVSEKVVDEIKALIILELQAEIASSLNVAKSIIRLRFGQILEEILGTPIVLDDDLLFGPEIFTPSIRIKANIYRLNNSTDKFIKEYVNPSLREDTLIMIPILSLFYMASTPILAGLVACINSRADTNWNDEAIISDNFKITPTNFVAREASRDTVLNGTTINKGDKLYAMLFESTGCPFSNQNILPFGHGKHLCPGADLSKLILKQTNEAMQSFSPKDLAALHKSSIQHGRGSAFLAFED